MTLAEIDTRVTFLTNANNTTEYTAANRLIHLNKWYDQVHSWILQSNDEWDFDDSNNTTIPIMTTNLVANQADYSLNTGSLRIKNVQVTYDGTNWYKATPLDTNEVLNATDTTSVANNFSASNPYYDMIGQSIVLYPAPTANVTAGIKVEIDRNVTKFTSSDVTTGTKEPGFDRNFHDILPLGIAYEWNSARKNDKSLMGDINLLKADLLKHYSNKQRDRKYGLNPYIENYK